MTRALAAKRLRVFAGLCCAALYACSGGAPPPNGDSLLITEVTILDGAGGPAFAGSVRVVDGVIEDVGDLEPRADERVFHGRGLHLAPGFIDTHSHADRGIFEHPDAAAAVSQGATTVVVGQDGHSPLPLEDFAERLAASGSAVNVAAYAGHNTIREAVMGADRARPARDDELEVMRALLREELDAGALGLSTGLEYEPGIYSDTDEVLSLAHLTAELGGRYISHLRSEDRWLDAAIEELLEIGRQTRMPVQISHIKLAMKRLWGRAPEIVQRLDDARAQGIDVSADIYPYEYWQSTMMVLLPERDPADRDAVAYALSELAPPDGIWFTRYAPRPEYVGMKLSDIATLRESDAVTAFTELALEAQAFADANGVGAEAIIGTSMHGDDIRTLLAWEHANIATDGGLEDLHPRGRGTYARVLGRYVREEAVLELSEAVRKMTGLAAEHMGFSDRGYVRSGQAADLVLFDPDTIVDRATPEAPHATSSGVEAVWVAGELVFANGEPTGARPGQFLRRDAASR